nr:PREDICTED: mucin-like protein 1 [Macaca fascicularis]
MKFLAVLVLLGVFTFLVSAQSPTTSAPVDTYPASESAPECHLFPAMTIFRFQPHVKQPVSMWTVSVIRNPKQKPVKAIFLILKFTTNIVNLLTSYTFLEHMKSRP